jgi:hypothetical protein
MAAHAGVPRIRARIATTVANTPAIADATPSATCASACATAAGWRVIHHAAAARVLFEACTGEQKRAQCETAGHDLYGIPNA